jgi:hypothetical protein
MRSGDNHQITGGAAGPTCRSALPNGADREMAGVAAVAVSSSSSCHAAHADAMGVGAVAGTRGNHRRRSAEA